MAEEARIIIDAQLQFRHDSEAAWLEHDPVLKAGEPAYTLGYPDRFKLGDGQSKWSELPYIKPGDGATTLDGLTDVQIGDMSGLSNEQKESQVLGYDSATGMWINKIKMYHHKQTSARTEWVITHNLGKMPNVKIVDSLKQLCFGDIFYNDMNTVTIRFGAAESGDAYLD